VPMPGVMTEAWFVVAVAAPGAIGSQAHTHATDDSNSSELVCRQFIM